MIGLGFLAGWGSLAALSMATNRDLLSPAKFYLLVCGVFFLDIFVSEYSSPVYWTYGAILLIGAVAVLLEACYPLPVRNVPLEVVAVPAGRTLVAVAGIWLITLIPLVSQLYLVHHFGGIVRYMASINLRVLAWRELGMFRAAIGSITIIHMVYLVIAIRSTRFGWAHRALYTGHLAIAVVLGAFSASRSSLLWNFVLLAVVYHFLKRPIRFRFVVIAVAVVLPLATLLNVARRGVGWSPREGLQTGLHEREWGVDSEDFFTYGTNPLRLLYSREPPPPQYGLTYATAVTTLVPRRIWPNKPEPGGLIFTREYTDDRWRGLSALAAGIIAESVLNFGWYGIPVGFGIMLLVVFGNYAFYRKLRSGPDGARHTLRVMVYAVVVPSTCMLLYMDFSNTGITMITRLSVLGMLHLALVSKMLRPLPLATPVRPRAA